MRKFNLNEFLWLLFLLLMALTIFYLLKTSIIFNLIHPKMTKYLIFSIVVLVLLSLAQVPMIFTIPDRGGIKKGIIVFLGALIMIGTVSREDISASNIASKGIKLSTKSYWKDIGDKHHHNEKIPQGVIELREENFYCYLEDIEKNLSGFIGREVIVEGMVYKTPSMKKDEFIIARMVMSCCAADAQVIGIKCSGNLEVNLNEQWVQLRGTIGKTKVLEDRKIVEVPKIDVASLKKMDKPNNLYIYQE
ncbi:TIGR03943 family protein [Clostridium polyendosporum]|uniref:TIGR03943 family protein n=1 Tax=Clostridium polyendosporum TaxID=69208 RepID=A0A919VGN0_9CLOT|nr:TIGR03943 family protein [Clostridium polyendosporum]GIM29342.1 TIGR03943 family protein [Clostridium polyendosporum]